MLGVDLKLLLGGSAALSGLCIDAGGLDVIIAVNTDYFLCDIVHAGEVCAEGGDGDLITLYLALETLENALHIVVRDVGSEELVDLIYVEREDGRFGLGGVYVDSAVDHVACAEKLNHLTSAEQTCHTVFRIETLLEASARFGSHAVFLCGHAHRRTREASRLEYDGGGAILDLTVRTAHNACESAGLLFIADGEHCAVEHVILVVERLEKLTVGSAAHVDSRAREHSVVKRVHRLTVLEHYVVGYVDDVIDRTNTCRAESHPEPKRRGLDLYVLYDLCGIAVAEVGVAYLDRKIIFDLISVAKLLDGGGGDIQGLIEADRGLASKTDDRKTVGAVGGYLELNDGIVKQERFLDVHADLVLKVLSENEDAVLDRLGHIVECEIQFCDRAEHSVRLNAAELACLDGNVTRKMRNGDSRGDDVALVDVLRARDDLSHRLSDVDLTDPEVVGVGVALHFENLCNDHVADILAENLVALYLRARVGHSVAVFLCGDTVCICKIVKPFK